MMDDPRRKIAHSNLDRWDLVSVNQQQVDPPPPPKNQDLAIIVPGGGCNNDGTPPSWVRTRLARAKALYDELECWIILLSAGTNHIGLPVKDSRVCNAIWPKADATEENAGDTETLRLRKGSVRAFPTFESEAGARYLSDKYHVPFPHMLIETGSYDTIGNALFCRQLFIDPLSLKKAFVVTSDFHLYRTKRIFGHVNSLEPAPQCELVFESVKSKPPQCSEEDKQETEDKWIQRFTDEEEQSKKYELEWGEFTDIHSYTRAFYYFHGCYTSGRTAFEDDRASGTIEKITYAMDLVTSVDDADIEGNGD